MQIWKALEQNWKLSECIQHSQAFPSLIHLSHLPQQDIPIPFIFLHRNLAIGPPHLSTLTSHHPYSSFLQNSSTEATTDLALLKLWEWAVWEQMMTGTDLSF